MTHLSLAGPRITCEPFTPGDITERFVAWLNDPEVNRYSRRRHQTSTRKDAEHFLSQVQAGEHVLAIRLKTNGNHIGNIQLGPMDPVSKHAEIRILLGDKSVWGQGYAGEAIYLATKHLFANAKAHRVEANSCNPAFMKCVQKLGWQMEGKLRERFWDGDRYVDYYWMSLLASEFKALPQYEEAGR